MNFRHTNDDDEELDFTPSSNEVGNYNGGYDYDEDDDDDSEPRRLNLRPILLIVVAVLVVGAIVATKFLDIGSIVGEITDRFGIISSEGNPSDSIPSDDILSSEEPSDNNVVVDDTPFEIQTPSQTPSEAIVLPSVSIQLPSVSLMPSEQPSEEPQPVVPTEINVTFSVDKNENGGMPIFTVHTNLPDNTRLLVTLSNNKGYKENQEHKPQNGVITTNAFSNNGSALPNGDYKITIKMLNSQYDSVKALIGENYEMLKGEYVMNVDGKYIAERSIPLKLTGTQNNNGNNNSVSEEELNRAIADANSMADMLGTVTPATITAILKSYNHSDNAIKQALNKCNIDWNDMSKKTLDAEKSELMKEADPETAMKEFLINEGFEQSLVETLVNNTLGKNNNNNNSNNGNFNIVG